MKSSKMELRFEHSSSTPGQLGHIKSVALFVLTFKLTLLLTSKEIIPDIIPVLKKFLKLINKGNLPHSN